MTGLIGIYLSTFKGSVVHGAGESLTVSLLCLFPVADL